MGPTVDEITGVLISGFAPRDEDEHRLTAEVSSRCPITGDTLLLAVSPSADPAGYPALVGADGR